MALLMLLLINDIAPFGGRRPDTEMVVRPAGSAPNELSIPHKLIEKCDVMGVTIWKPLLMSP